MCEHRPLAGMHYVKRMSSGPESTTNWLPSELWPALLAHVVSNIMSALTAVISFICLQLPHSSAGSICTQGASDIGSTDEALDCAVSIPPQAQQELPLGHCQSLSCVQSLPIGLLPQSCGIQLPGGQREGTQGEASSSCSTEVSAEKLNR